MKICKRLLTLMLISIMIMLCGCSLELKETKEVPTMENFVILSSNGVHVEVIGLEYDSMYGWALKFKVNNETSEDVVLKASLTSINDYMIGTTLSGKVLAGAASEVKMEFLSEEIENCGIDTIANVGFKLTVLNAADYSVIDTSEPVTFPTSAHDTYNYTYKSGGEEVYRLDYKDKETGNITTCFKIMDQGIYNRFDEEKDIAIRIFAENYFNTPITLQILGMEVNGNKISNSFGATVAHDKKLLSYIKLKQSDLDAIGVTDDTISEIKYQFVLHDAEGKLAETGVIVHNISDSNNSVISIEADTP